MSRRSASGTARVALIGAASPDGHCLRDALSAAGVPGGRVELYGMTGGEVVLSEYRGEARLIQEPSASEISDHDVVFLCESGELADRVVASDGPGALVIDLAGISAARSGVPVVHLDINPAVARAGQRLLAVPLGIAAILAELLAALDAGVGVRQAVAVVMRPVSDFGEEGTEELREQTVRLFNFGTVPKTRFGRQISFNLIPQRLMNAGRDDPELDRRIAREVGQMLGWTEPRLALRLVSVPVFYGHAACVRVEPARAAGAPEAIASLEGIRGLRGPTAGGSGTPLEVAEERRTVAAEVSEDGLGGIWLWVVAGEVGRVPAELAVRLAATLVDL